MDYKEKVLINGRKVSIVATYKDEELNKDFIIYTDETKDEYGKLKVFYGSYRVIDGKIEVQKVKSSVEESKILEVLKHVTKEFIDKKEI